MKKVMIILVCTLLVMTSLAGCQRNVPADTTGSIVPSTTVPATTTTAPTQTTPSDTQNGNAEPKSQSCQLLEQIWAEYGENERFAAYGGTVEHSVSDAPGELDMSNTQELTTAYLLPQDQLSAVEEGASLVHMMNNNIFTGVVFKMKENADQKTLYETWRDAIQNNQWICGQPDRLLMVNVDGSHLLMAFGSNEAMETFKSKVTNVFGDAETLYDGAVVV